MFRKQVTKIARELQSIKTNKQKTQNSRTKKYILYKQQYNRRLQQQIGHKVHQKIQLYKTKRLGSTKNSMNGQGCSSVGRMLAQQGRKPWVQSPTLQSTGTVAQASNSSTREVEAGRSEIQITLDYTVSGGQPGAYKNLGRVTELPVLAPVSPGSCSCGGTVCSVNYYPCFLS